MDEIAEQERKEFQGVAGSNSRRKRFGLGRLKVTGAGGKKLAGVAVIVVIVVAVIGVVMVPNALLEMIHRGLLSTTGFEGTAAYLRDLAIHVGGHMLQSGEVPSGLAEDLLSRGIEVGQVTLAGEFVRTNSYIADIDGTVAAEGDYQSHGTGELAVRFNGEVTRASEFVARVESDPELFLAYDEAVDITARYYYSDEMNAAYKKMGVNKGVFSSWQETGDVGEDAEEFQQILEAALNESVDVNTASKYKKWTPCIQEGENGEVIDCGWTSEWVDWDDDVSGNDDGSSAEDLIRNVTDNSRVNDDVASADQNAAQLLNATVSSSEPYLATNAFLVVMEAIEQAKAGDNGPVNYVMNALSTPTEVSYMDVNTGETVTSNKSVLESTNFVAAITGGEFSKEEASNFSRDRVLKMTGLANDNAISSTVVSSNGGEKSGLGIVMNNDDVSGNGAANYDVLAVAENSVEVALMEKNSELFSSVVGANRIIEGGSFLHSSTDLYVLGAMPSDEAAVQAYQKEVDTMIARQEAAERATKSPFDISSPYTFLGNIAQKIAAAMLINDVGNNSVMASLGKTTFGLMKNAFGGIFSSAVADGSENSIATTSGDCVTTKVAGVTCDPYDSQRTTLVTKYMDYTMDDWRREFPDSFDNNGEIKDDSELAKFVRLAMDRTTTVGVSSYEVCESYRNQEFNIIQRFFVAVAKGAGNLTDACTGGDGFLSSWIAVPKDVADGTRYTISDSNEEKAEVEKYSAFVSYDMVYSLMSERASSVTMYREKYTDDFMGMKAEIADKR